MTCGEFRLALMTVLGLIAVSKLPSYVLCIAFVCCEWYFAFYFMLYFSMH